MIVFPKKRKPQERGEILKAVFASPLGEEALDVIADYCGLFASGFDRDSERQTAKNCGKREVALWLINEVRKDTDNNG